MKAVALELGPRSNPSLPCKVLCWPVPGLGLRSC